MKRIIAFILLAILLLGFLAPAVRAEETETTETTEATEETKSQEKKTEGWMEDDFYWKLEGGTLTIYGDGVMPGGTPWRDYSQQIEKLVFDGNIYTVATAAFRDCHMLKEVSFSSAITEIWDYAFQGCTALREIRLPSGFKKFGASSFGGCTSLTQVYCNGYMPRFEENCLWNGERIYVYYAPDKVWGESDIKTLERNFGGRLEVLCQDGTDPIPNEEGDPEPLAPVAETEPVETEPTVPTTVATEPPMVTQPDFIDVEALPVFTEPETQPETTEAPTEAATESTEPVLEEEESAIRGGFIGLAMILGVLTFFLVGALAFRSRSRRGRY